MGRRLHVCWEGHVERKKKKKVNLKIAFDELCSFNSSLYVKADVHFHLGFMVRKLDDGHLRTGQGINPKKLSEPISASGLRMTSALVSSHFWGPNISLLVEPAASWWLTVALSRTLMGYGPATLCFRRARSSSCSGGRSHFPNTTRSMSLRTKNTKYFVP